MDLHRRVHSVVSGDTLERRKPHPEPLLHAAAEIGLEASECVYAGDARRDIEAGRAAGMQTVGVTWGYILQEDPATGWLGGSIAGAVAGIVADSSAGSVAGAMHIRAMSKLYGVPVILHTDHCARKLLPWVDGLLDERFEIK